MPLPPRAPGAPGRPRSPGPGLKARAVAYLSRREHSRAELARKLARHAQPDDDIDAVLDALQREGWLSDARYVQSVVHRRAGGRGAARIVQELRQQGVSDDQLGAVRQQLRATELDRARAAWAKRYGKAPSSPAEYAKQARFLAGRGFDHYVIRKVLGEADD